MDQSSRIEEKGEGEDYEQEQEEGKLFQEKAELDSVIILFPNG